MGGGRGYTKKVEEGGSTQKKRKMRIGVVGERGEGVFESSVSSGVTLSGGGRRIERVVSKYIKKKE